MNADMVSRIADDLLNGGTAALVGGRSLHGMSTRYIEIDGVPVACPAPRATEAIGVRTTLPSGYTALYLTTTHERARRLLDDARLVVRKIGSKTEGQVAPVSASDPAKVSADEEYVCGSNYCDDPACEQQHEEIL